jgi:ABC-type sugar transport system ATPase subunit
MPNSGDAERDQQDSRRPVNGGSPPLLQMRGIEKSFPGVKALSGASIDLRAGEIHTLVGENGAGKSTLIKILNGVHEADAGEILVDGKPVAFQSPLEAKAAGIATIYQEFTLIPSLSVLANLFLGRERTRKGFIDSAHERNGARAVLARLEVEIDVGRLVADLTVAQQQLVEIARALACEARILVMDEPTAALAPQEVESLFRILRELTARGIGVVFISHRLDEVFQIADRITVLRDGVTIETRRASDYTRQQLIEQMVGRSIEEEYPKATVPQGETRFEVKQLTGGKVRDVSFSVKRGEVVGFAGLMGAGRTEVARLIFGVDRRQAGEIVLDGRALGIKSPRDAIKQGICLLTEDRKTQGLVLRASAMENFSLPNLPAWSRLGWINQRMERARFSDRVRSLNIRLTGANQRAEDLSGGNQQKLLVARWLETDSQVIIFDEPTRGIDVGAKHEMYLLINDLALHGKAIIVISSELPELLGICDRILVMREGLLVGEISDVRNARQEDIMSLAIKATG